jgi:hypothetical protein
MGAIVEGEPGSAAPRIVIPPEYDASLRALLRPDLSEPGRKWSALLCDGILSTGLFRAECARLAYCRFEEEPDIEARLHAALGRSGYPLVQTFNIVETRTRAFAAYDPKQRSAIVAFRGTQADEIRDIALDLQVTVENWPTGGTVHRGFATAARRVMPAVQRWLDSAAADRHSLVLTGHSLGAALAVLAASQWKPDAVAAFGCPRVGDAAFARSVASIRIDRFCNCCDLVCRLPPECLWYTHVGTHRYISRLGVLIDSMTPRAIMSDQIAARTEYLFRYFWRFGAAAARELADHAMINYLRAFA